MPAVINPDADRLTAEWFAAGESFALATVVETLGSAPLPVGSAMAVGPDGTALGSVSGGCVEGAVYESACAVRDDGVPRLERFGYSDGEAFAVGLTCGGTVTVLIERIDRKTCPHYGVLVTDHMRDGSLGWVRTLPAGPESTVAHLIHGSSEATLGSLGAADIDGLAIAEVAATLGAGITGMRRLPGTAMRVFVRSLVPPPRLIVVGATEYATALATLARPLGMHVTVCDARPVFAAPQRFPDADEVVCDWPHRYLAHTRIDRSSAICVLTHDAKFDVPALLAAFATDAGYIGAMGSRRTHRDRLRRLRESGATPDMLRRLHSPIGLDLGGRAPAEVALSILAEIVSTRNHRSAAPLGESITRPGNPVGVSAAR